VVEDELMLFKVDQIHVDEGAGRKKFLPLEREKWI